MAKRKSTSGGGRKSTSGGGRKSTTGGGRKSTTGGGRKSMTGGKKSKAGGGGGRKGSTGSKKKGGLDGDLFHPPWPMWDDLTLCAVRWDEMPSLEGFSKVDKAGLKAQMDAALRNKGAKGGRKSSAGSRKSLGGKRKSAAGGSRKSSAGRKSAAGGARKSAAGGARKSAAGGARKSAAGGARKSAAGGARKSAAGGARKSAAGGPRKSKASGSRKSMGGGKKSKDVLTTGGTKEHGVVLKKWRDRTKVDKDADIVDFKDPVGHGTLPPTMKPIVWRRPTWENDQPPTLDPEDEPLDLYTNNQHLFKYKIMRQLISSLMSLNRTAVIHNFPVELQGASFGNNSDEHWKPINHVYALTKSGPGFDHRPQFNPFGLYYVRMFYMGQWRRVAVDEYFPYDASGQLLYPTSAKPRNIWMPLLTKALFKVASMSWTAWDDAFDFDPIRLLTGWLHIEIDTRFMTEDTLWRIIQHNLVHRPNALRPPCVPRDQNHCIHEELDIYMDEPGMRFLYLETLDADKTEDCPLDPRYHHFGYITMADNDTVPDDLPKWKNYRWVDWAISNGYIRGRPGSVRRVVDFYLPLKKSPPQLVSTTIERPADDGTKEKKEFKVFKSDTYYFENVYKCFQKLHVYYRTSYFKYSRNIDNIPKEIEAVQQKGLEEGAQKTGVIAGKMKPKSETEIKRCNITGDCFYLWSDTLFCKNFIFTLHVLNEDRSMPAGFLIVEGWKWSLEAQGPVWFSLRTYSTKSQALNLGPGMQMMRIWYSLPHTYHLTIHSKSQFTLCIKEQITNLASLESSSLFFYGEEMAAAYSKLIKMEPGSVRHAEQLAAFLTTMCPPFIMCSSIPNPIEPKSIMTRQELMPLFEEKAMQMVFDFVHKAEVDKIAKIVVDYQKWFLEKKFGENYLAENGYKDILEMVKKDRLEKWNKYYLGRLNSVRRLDGFPPLAELPDDYDVTSLAEVGKDGKPKARKSKAGGARKSKAGGARKSKTGGRKSTSGSRKSTSGSRKSSAGSRKSTSGARKSTGGARKSTGGQRKSATGSRKSTTGGGGKRASKAGGEGGSKKRSASIHGGHKGEGVTKDTVYNQFLLENPVNNAILLRRMTQNRENLLKQYPFRYDDTVRLSYFDFASVTEMVAYPTKWVLVGRVVVNIHSSAPTPVGFHLLTETKPINMALYDMDTNDIVPLGLDSNFTYYISRNTAGYCLLLHGYPPVEERDKSAQWRVRAFGPRAPEIPHVCSLSPPWGWGELGGPTKRNIDDTKAPGEFKMKEEIEKRNKAPNGERWGYCSGQKGPNPTLVMTYISENYFPNAAGLICKFLITIKRAILPPAALVTLCFNASRSTVKMRMKLKGADGKIVKEAYGVGICLLPAVYLTVEEGACDDRITPFDDEAVKAKQEVFYTGEVWVVENSWPLTQKEYNVLDLVRKDPPPEDNKRIARRVAEGAPNWKLIMVVENEQRNDVVLGFDNRCSEGFKKMKEKMWDFIDPDRLDRGRRLREDFLIELMIERGEYPGEDEEELWFPEDESKSTIEPDKGKRPSLKDEPKVKKISKKSVAEKKKSAYVDVEVDMGTDYVEFPDFKSKTMEELYDRFKNPDEDPSRVARVVEILPYKTNAPARLGPFDVFLDYVPVDEFEGSHWHEGGYGEMEEEETIPPEEPKPPPRKPSLGLPLGYMDPLMESAQKEIHAWADKKMDKMYQIREEVIKELKKRKEEQEENA